MAADCIKDLCRTCVDRSDNYIRIYDKVVPDNIPFYCIINDVCQLSIRAKDGFPEYVCQDCFVKISEFVIFKRKCHVAKTNLISMIKSFSEEGAWCHELEKETDRDAKVGEKELDMATEIIEKQMDSDSDRDDVSVLEEIITMPFEVDYEEILVVDNLPNEVSKKATGYRRERRGPQAGRTRKRKSSGRISEEGGENEKKMREEYIGDGPEEKPKITSVAQSYYKYILEKEKHNSSAKSGGGKKDEVSTPSCNAIGTDDDASSADIYSKESLSDENEKNVVEDLLMENSKQNFDNSNAVEINDTTLNIVEAMNPVVKMSGGGTSKEGEVKGIKDSLASEIRNDVTEIIFDPSDDEVAYDDGSLDCSDSEHGGESVVAISDPQILSACKLSDGVTVLDGEEQDPSEHGNLSSSTSNAPVKLPYLMESSDKNKEKTVKKVSKDKSKDPVKLIKVLASEDIPNGRDYAEELVRSNFSEKKVQVCDIGPLGNVFHVEPTIVKLKDIHQLCHPDTRILKSVVRTPKVSDAPTRDEASTKVEEGVGVKKKESNLTKSGVVGGRIISTMKLRSKKEVGKAVNRTLCEQRSKAIDMLNMANQLTGKKGRRRSAPPQKNTSIDESSEAVCAGMSPTGDSSEGQTSDDVSTTIDASESSVSTVIRTKKNSLPPKKRPVEYSPAGIPSSCDNVLEQTDKLSNLSNSQIIREDSSVPSPSKKFLPEAQKYGLKSLSVSLQDRKSECSGAVDSDTVNADIQLGDEEDITGTLLLTPAADNDAQAPPVAIILRKLANDEKVKGDKESSVAKKLPKGSTPRKPLYMCEYCDEPFKKRRFLDSHQRSVHPERVRKIFGCTICGGEFISQVGLNRHAKRHKGKNGSEETSGQQSASHVRRERNRPHTCPKCGVTVRGKLALTIHNTEVHLKEPVYPCSFCKYKFLKKERKELHENQCGYRRLQCVHCNKMITASSLTQHMFTHTGQKPFLCSMCGSRFSQKGDLGRHMKHFHMGQAPPRDYLCSYCPKAFTVPSKLLVHERIHTGEKPYSCEECGRKFAYSQSLRNHQENRETSCLPVIEQASKPFVCVVCKKGWDTKYNLNKHIAWVHEMKRPERSFCCDICLKRYYCRSQLAYHMRIHTNEKPYACKHCDCRYMYSGMLKTHVKKEHPGAPIN